MWRSKVRTYTDDAIFVAVCIFSGDIKIDKGSRYGRMGKKEVVVEDIVTIAGVTLIPVADITIKYWHGDGKFMLLGIKRPTFVVLVTPSFRKAFRISGEEISLDLLMHEVPAIVGTLERL